MFAETTTREEWSCGTHRRSAGAVFKTSHFETGRREGAKKLLASKVLVIGACPFDVPVYDVNSNTCSIPNEKCVDCGQCRDICPGSAIIPGPDARKVLSIYIDEEACIGCSLCARNCPAGAITGEIKHPFTIHEDKCIKCGFCLTKCKKDALRATFSTVYAKPVI